MDELANDSVFPNRGYLPSMDFLDENDNGELGPGGNPRLMPDGTLRYSPEPPGTPEPPSPRSPEELQNDQPGNRQSQISAFNSFPQALQLVNSATEFQGQIPAGRSTAQQITMSDNGFDDDGGA